MGKLIGQREKEQAQVDKWNKKYPIGTPVTVKKDNGEIIRTTTRSEAEMLAGKVAVIWVEGIAGCYGLDRVIARNKEEVKREIPIETVKSEVYEAMCGPGPELEKLLPLEVSWDEARNILLKNTKTKQMWKVRITEEEGVD